MPEISQEQMTEMAKAGLQEAGLTDEVVKMLREMKEVKRLPIGDTSEAPQTDGPKFKNLAETLKAIVKFETTRELDERFKAVSGMGEGVNSDGGFLLQPEIAAGILMRSYAIGAITQRCRKITIGGNANSIKFNAINETSRASTRWGGILGYWIEEAGAKTATHPTFRQMTLDLKKVVAAFYATDELLADVAALESLSSQGFAEELNFQVEDSIINGTGVGKPLGILNSPSLVTVAAEGGQVATTINFENIQKMWARMWAPSRANAVWFINQDCEPQLNGMHKVVGVGGIPVYLPANGISGAPYNVLMGRPVVPVEYCQTLGTVGDIILADLSQYVLADKGGVQSASSAHVRFMNDEQVFRFVYRVDGQPLWNSPLTPFKGSNTLSPFIALATRS